MLLSDSKTAYEKAAAAGCDAELQIYEGMFHEFQMSLNLIPESRNAWKEVRAFIRKKYQLGTDNPSRRLGTHTDH